MILSNPASSLATLELQLRWLLPAELYAAAWVDPLPANLMRVFEHLRTLQRILHDYTPRPVYEAPPRLGEIRYTWQEGTLLFTDLAGFTSLMEANASHGRQGAMMLLNVLNDYFSQMLEIISKSGGDLLEFTGDAMLVQFLADQHQNDTARAVRAGLRMQRAMAQFANIATAEGQFSLEMRVGIHSGRFLSADIGTPMRMARVLLGRTVQQAKQVEGIGWVGRVCLSEAAGDRLRDRFRIEPIEPGYFLVKDDFTAAQLGEYDIKLTRRRIAGGLLIDRSETALLGEIEELVKRIEPLACYLPPPLLNLLVENAAQRQIPPNFPEPTVVFVNLVGLPESVDAAAPEEVDGLIASFSRVFALIDAAVRSRQGILQKVTYQLIGSDILIYFGVVNAHTDDAIRAAETALAVREIVSQMTPPIVAGEPVDLYCRIGMTCGSVFAAEIGELRGRREFNILGDSVNTAARLMTQAERNQILMTEDVYQAIAHQFDTEALGAVFLKGKALAVPIFALQGRLQD